MYISVGNVLKLLSHLLFNFILLPSLRSSEGKLSSLLSSLEIILQNFFCVLLLMAGEWLLRFCSM